MSTKLEMRLAEYEKHTPITTDEELVRAIRAILEEEDALPSSKRDLDLIEEATEAYTSLVCEDEKELECRAEEIASRHLSKVSTFENEVLSPRLLKLKRFLPVAALVSLLIVGAIVTSAVRNTMFDDKSRDLEESLAERADISSTGEYVEFESLEALIQSKDYAEMPKPRTIPLDFTVKSISVQNSCLEAETGYLVDYTMLDIVFSSAIGVQHVTVEAPAYSFNTEGMAMTINGNEVFLREKGNGYECSFYLRGYVVTVSAPTLENLRRTVSSIS